MARELPPTYEKDYLELLYDYHSDETKKSRRNVIVVSFVVVSIHFLGLNLADIKAGVELAKANPQAMIALAMALILYWLVMFLAYSFSDRQIHHERRYLLSKLADDLETELSTFEAQCNDNYVNQGRRLPDEHRQRLAKLKSDYSLWVGQRKRTRLAARLRAVMTGLEHLLPVFLAAWALSYLFVDLWRN